MDPILPELHSALADLEPEARRFRSFPPLPRAPPRHGSMPTYWVANVRQPVRLAARPSPAAAATTRPSSRSALIPPGACHHRNLESTHHHSIGTLSRDGDDTVSFHTNLNNVQRPPAADSPSAGTASGAAQCALAPHPALDQAAGYGGGGRIQTQARHPARPAHRGRHHTTGPPVAGAAYPGQQALSGFPSQQRHGDRSDIGSVADTFGCSRRFDASMSLRCPDSSIRSLSTSRGDSGGRRRRIGHSVVERRGSRK